jgi:gluconolactonase
MNITSAPKNDLIAGPPEVLVGTTWLEGISAAPDGSLFFSDVRGNRLLRLSSSGLLTVFRSPSNYSNGTVFDSEARLVVCEEGDPQEGLPPRITRTDLRTNRIEVLVDNIAGRRLMGPNDVRVDRLGRLYFTDGARPFFLPPYGSGTSPNGTSGATIPTEAVPSTGVYRIDPDGKVVQILTPPVTKQPNGLGISPDAKTFYLIENDIAADGLRQILAFDLHADGSVTNKRVLHDFRPGRSGDGMIVDASGNLWVAAGLNFLRNTAETLATKAGIYVFTAAGKALEFVPIPEDTVTNLTFGSVDRGVVYITAGKTVYKLATHSSGIPIMPTN